MLDATMLRARIAGVGVALALGLAAPDAGADPEGVEAALRLYREGALSDALAAFRRALATGRNDRAGLATVYLHLGVLSAGARDPEGATDAFERLLSLDPTATPPAGSSPLVTEPFERARTRRGTAPVLGADVTLPARIPAGQALSFDVAVHGDPGGLAREARAVAEAEGARTEATASGEPPFRLSLPARATAAAGRLRLHVSLHDEHGSLLAATTAATTVGSAVPDARTAATRATVEPPDRAAPVGRTDGDEGRGGSVLASPWFWGGTAVLVAGGVVAALLLTQPGDDQAHFGPVEVQR